MQSTGTFKAKPITYDKGLTLRFLYKTLPGRIILYFLAKTAVSKLAGRVMDGAFTKAFIPGFIKQNNLDMGQYEDTAYRSFNDFFERKVKAEYRPFPQNENEAIAPCDGKLTAYKITADSEFHIKHSEYTVSDLLKDELLAAEYTDGICLIYRLTPDDYHRFCYIDDGQILESKKIDGVLHTVRPVTQRRYNVLTENSREYALMQTENFGKVVQMEVGALFVGKIVNYKAGGAVKRGEERGLFRFGASTIIMLYQKNTLTLAPEIYENTTNNKETLVKMGETIGMVL